MPKLDKQGLNTFIRELDKHINTKINRLDISPTADKVLMSDGTSVEESVNANKTSILSIKNLENEEVEVRKIETEENFIAVEDTKNGYFTDIKLEGKTLVNLAKNSFGFGNQTVWSNWVLGDTILENGKTYTIIFDVPAEITSFSIYNISAENVLQPNTPIQNLKFTYYTSFSDNGIFLIGSKVITQDIVNKIKIIILEGDHTDKPISYFEGIKSVGQDVSEISVLSGLPNTKKIIVTNFEVGNINSNDGSDLESSNLARSIEYIPTNGSKFALVKWRLGFDKFVCYNENKNILPSGGYRTILKEGDIFYMSLNDNVKYIRVVANIDSLTNSPNVKCEISLLDSQDKKRILYYNSDTKAWEKPVLREWDSIEKHSDGKYYYHQRSGEITLNGSEGWASYGSGSLDTNNTKLFYANLLNNIQRLGNGKYICDSLNYGSENVNNTENADSLWMNSASNYSNHCYIRVSKSKLSAQTVEGFKTWLQSNNVTVVYQLAEEKVYECTNLDLISYQDETNYIASTGAITPKSSFNVNNGVSDVVKLLQQRTALSETHEHENYQKHKLTNNSGHHVRTISNANDEYAQRYTCFLYQWGGDNRPTDSSFNILNISNGSTLQHQLYFRVDGSIYCRCRLNSSWTNWQKITTSSTFSLLEEQVATLETQATENEKKISILECENKALKEELTQIQISIASLTSLITTLEEK